MVLVSSFIDMNNIDSVLNYNIFVTLNHEASEIF